VNAPDQLPPVLEAAKDEKLPGGKRLSDIDQTKNDATGRASDVGRQLAFAGIATIWLLRDEAGTRPFGNVLLIALTLLALALLADFLQYVYCSFVWRRFYNEQFDKHKNDDALVDIPDSLSERTYIFFKTKIGLLFVGYVFLLIGATTKLRIF